MRTSSFLLVVLLGAVAATLVSAQIEDVLFVVNLNNGQLQNLDQPFVDHFITMGWTYLVIDDGAVTLADTVGRMMVVVSESADSNAVGNKFDGIDVPLITWEANLLDNFDMANNPDFRDERDIDILIPDHYIANGNPAGTLRFLNNNRLMSVGQNLGAGAVVIANADNRPGIFCYEAGGILADGSAALARKCNIPYSRDADGQATPEGWAIMYRALEYTATGGTTIAPSTTVDPDGVQDGTGGLFGANGGLTSLLNSGSPVPFIAGGALLILIIVGVAVCVVKGMCCCCSGGGGSGGGKSKDVEFGASNMETANLATGKPSQLSTADAYDSLMLASTIDDEADDPRPLRSRAPGVVSIAPHRPAPPKPSRDSDADTKPSKPSRGGLRQGGDGLGRVSSRLLRRATPGREAMALSGSRPATSLGHVTAGLVRASS